MCSYDLWKTDPDRYYGCSSRYDEEEEPTADEYAFLEWCDEMLQLQDAREDAPEPGGWIGLGGFVILLDPENRPEFWSTCVLPSGASVALKEWLRF